MDELTLVRRVTSPPAEPDAEMLARARARLVAEAGRRRGDRPHGIVWLAVAVAAAVLAAGVGWAVAGSQGNAGVASPGSGAGGSTGRVALSLRLVDDQVQLVTSASQASLASQASVTAMACFTATTCVAVGDAATGAGAGAGAVAATSDDGGAQWTEQPLPAGLTSLTSLTCPAAGACWATGTTATGPAIVAVAGSGGWVRQPVPGSVTALTSVSCPTVDACWAVGKGEAGGAILRPSGTGSWEAVPVPEGVASLSSVGCAAGMTPAVCLAVGTGRSGPAVVDTTDGTRWVVSTTPPGAIGLASAACTGPVGPICTTLVETGDYWRQTSRFFGGSPTADQWRGATIPAGATVAPGTVMAGVSSCVIINGPSCTPDDESEVNTVMQVVGGLEGTNSGGPLDESISSGDFNSTTGSPVWYMGVAGQGLDAYLALTPTQRLYGIAGVPGEV